MFLRIGKLLTPLIVVSAVIGGSALAAGSGNPKTRSGKSAQLVASNVAVPTSFAFGSGEVFFSDGTPPSEAPLGGVYVIKDGVPTKLPGSPAFSFGVAWHKGKLYVSTPNSVEAWSGWNGTTFSKQKVIYKAPAKFTGFNGLAFGADGRLYAGVSLQGDHGPAKAPFQYDVLSMSPTGKNVKVFARGMRQPWQPAFAKGSSSPYVSDLGQDAGAGAGNAPDFVLHVRKGQNYGFPKCNQTKASACQGFAKPFHSFAPHTDAMGLGVIGKRLFISEFGGSTPARVVSMPLHGGKARVELKGFPKGRNIVGLGTHNGWVYVGEIASGPSSLGAIYRFKP